MRVEIKPVRKDKDGRHWPCGEDEKTGYGVYFDDEFHGARDTKAEAEKLIADILLETGDTPAPENRLYHVHEYENGTDTSLLVVARSPWQAVGFFDEHWQNAFDGYVPDEDILVHVAIDFSLDKPGPLRWGVLGGMVLVGQKQIDEWIEEGEC